MSFFEELKRRKVFRTIAAYAVVAFIIMQLVEIVFPMFEIPDWAGRMVILLLFVGFPIIIVFSWIYDVTDKGLVRTQQMQIGGVDDARPMVGRKRTWFIIGGIALGIIVGISASSKFLNKGLSGIDSKSIAVLPFDNMSDSKDDEYFSDGITEDIISELAKINDLFVISRTSIMRYKDTDKSMKEIGKELGVSTILEGSVRKIGDRVRIVGQLIETATDKHLWTDRYDLELTDIFEVQDQVAKAIAGALKIELSSEETAKIAMTPTKNIEAYELYLKGKSLFYTYEVLKVEKSTEFFQKALKKDPEFALAHAGISKAYMMLRMRQFVIITPVATMLIEKASEHAHIALELAPNDPEVLFALGYYYFYGSNELKKANEAYQKTVELNPKHAHAHDEIADLLHQEKGLIEEAFNEYEIALTYDPYLIPALWNVGDLYIKKGQFGKSLQHLDKALEIYPNVDNFYLLKAIAQYAQNDFLGCRSTLDQLTIVSHRISSFFYKYQVPVINSLIFLKMGEIDAAEKFAHTMTRESLDNEAMVPYSYYLNGFIELEKGNYEIALSHFNKLFTWKYVFNIAGTAEPMLRDIARFGRGEAYFHQGNFFDALNEFQSMRTTYSGESNDFIYDQYWPRKHYKIGLCYEKMGNTHKALDHYEKFLKIWSEADEDIEDIVDAKRRITKLKAKV